MEPWQHEPTLNDTFQVDKALSSNSSTNNRKNIFQAEKDTFTQLSGPRAGEFRPENTFLDHDNARQSTGCNLHLPSTPLLL
jgi:hypothetical protein